MQRGVLKIPIPKPARSQATKIELKDQAPVRRPISGAIRHSGGKNHLEV
jgi:hypothetical protein